MPRPASCRRTCSTRSTSAAGAIAMLRRLRREHEPSNAALGVERERQPARTGSPREHRLILSAEADAGAVLDGQRLALIIALDEQLVVDDDLVVLDELFAALLEPLVEERAEPLLAQRRNAVVGILVEVRDVRRLALDLLLQDVVAVLALVNLRRQRTRLELVEHGRDRVLVLAKAGHLRRPRRRAVAGGVRLGDIRHRRELVLARRVDLRRRRRRGSRGSRRRACAGARRHGRACAGARRRSHRRRARATGAVRIGVPAGRDVLGLDLERAVRAVAAIVGRRNRAAGALLLLAQLLEQLLLLLVGEGRVVDDLLEVDVRAGALALVLVIERVERVHGAVLRGRERRVAEHRVIERRPAELAGGVTRGLVAVELLGLRGELVLAVADRGARGVELRLAVIGSCRRARARGDRLRDEDLAQEQLRRDALVRALVGLVARLDLGAVRRDEPVDIGVGVH